MPKLLQINVVVNWGSTGRIAEEIGQLAMTHGWESYIAYGRGKPKSKSKLIRIGSDWDMYLHGVESRLLDNHGLASRMATHRLIKQIEMIAPDIIHLHNIHGYFLNYKILFAYLSQSRIPVIWTLHDCWAFTGHCSYFTYVNCTKWVEGCFSCSQIKTYPCSLFRDRSRKNYQDKKQTFTILSDAVIVPVSDWLMKLVKQSFLKNYPIQRIYNGVDLKAFMCLQESINMKNLLGNSFEYMLLGVASVWNSRKGLSDFISLRKRLSDKYMIVLIGLNKEQIEKLPKGIIGISRTNSVKELAKYYSAADVFVNPTWEDNFPTTNLEALACGTPVITYRTGGSIEAIDEYTGIIVEPGDIQMLSNAVEQICEKKRVLFTREQCRRRAVDLYDKNERYWEYLSLYDSLLK